MSMNLDVASDNARFLRRTRQILLGFVGFVLVYVVVSTCFILRSTPAYLHDWRGIAIIALNIVVCVVFAFPIVARKQDTWPMPLALALGLWLAVYLATLALTLIDTSFVWDFYVVAGYSLAVLHSRALVVAVSIDAITTFAFQGLLIWPLQEGPLLGIIGESMGFFSMAGFGMLMQRMISERFERNELLEQLTQANAELEEAHRQLAQSVEQEQELAVLRERNRLAREMHDTLGHALVLISVKLEAAQRLRERDPERCERELESTKEIARETMAALRASIANLRSPALEREHIYHALCRSSRELAQRSGLHVTCSVPQETDNLPESIAETLWKVSQEAFTNIEKHAHASNVEVRISRDDGKLLLSIQDDGVGLPRELYRPGEDGEWLWSGANGHYGLRGMLERVRGAGGRISLRSSDGQGTTIEVELPLNDQIASDTSDKSPACADHPAHSSPSSSY